MNPLIVPLIITFSFIFALSEKDVNDLFNEFIQELEKALANEH